MSKKRRRHIVSLKMNRHMWRGVDLLTTWIAATEAWMAAVTLSELTWKPQSTTKPSCMIRKAAAL